MFKRHRFPAQYGSLVCILLVVTLGGCTTVATRPSERLALVELQVNNSPTQSDDFVPVGPPYTPARLRIMNTGAAGVAKDVLADVTNMDMSFGGRLRFALPNPDCTTMPPPIATDLVVTLPKNGTWVNICIQSDPSHPSAGYPDAIIQVDEARNDGVVLARVPVVAGNAFSIPPSESQVVIEFDGTPQTIDDYVSWVPRRATIRAANPTAQTSSLIYGACVQNDPYVTGMRGKLLFAPAQASGVPQPSTMSTSLPLTFRGDGTPTSFFIAGQFGHPSLRDKDAIIRVTDCGGNGGLVAYAATMVRVRKDANTLAPAERDRFIEALYKFNASYGLMGTVSAPGLSYFNYQDIHNHSDGTVHSFATVSSSAPNPWRPLFLPWHRLFILRLERELQAVDPAVTLPYWNFAEEDPTKAPTNIFSPDFMGGPSSTQWAAFSAGSLMDSWQTMYPTYGTGGLMNGIQRFPRFAPYQLPMKLPTTLVGDCSPPWGQSHILNSLSNIFGTINPTDIMTPRFMQVELAHNAALLAAGGTSGPLSSTCTDLYNNAPVTLGWLATNDQAVRDPLFFLLLANVDRLWGKWQQQNTGRFNPYDPNTFPNQGSAPGGTANPQYQQYLLDPLWPWSTTGAPGGPFPQTPGQVFAPPEVPSILNAIDYQQTWLGITNPPQLTIGLGYDYDDVPFQR